MTCKKEKYEKAKSILKRMKTGDYLDTMHEGGDAGVALVKDLIGLMNWAKRGGWETLEELRYDIGSWDITELVGVPFLVYGATDTRCWIYTENDKLRVDGEWGEFNSKWEE